MFKCSRVAQLLFFAYLAIPSPRVSTASEPTLSEPLQNYVMEIIADVDKVPADRQEVLAPLVQFIAARLDAGKPADVMAICTANSRRSQFTHVWAHTAARHFGLEGVRAYSAGTQATACNERTVAALKQAGFAITRSSAGENPMYELRLTDGGEPLKLWSKTIDDPHNAQQDFAALMCCSDASEACPLVEGAALRVPLLYEDPKSADGTPEEQAAYDAKCREIAREMFWVMARVAEKRGE